MSTSRKQPKNSIRTFNLYIKHYETSNSSHPKKNGEDFVVVAFFHHPISSCAFFLLPNPQSRDRWVDETSDCRLCRCAPNALFLALFCQLQISKKKATKKSHSAMVRKLRGISTNLKHIWMDLMNMSICLPKLYCDFSAMDSAFAFPCRKT